MGLETICCCVPVLQMPQHLQALVVECNMPHSYSSLCGHGLSNLEETGNVGTSLHGTHERHWGQYCCEVRQSNSTTQAHATPASICWRPPMAKYGISMEEACLHRVTYSSSVVHPCDLWCQHVQQLILYDEDCNVNCKCVSCLHLLLDPPAAWCCTPWLQHWLPGRCSA